MSEKRLIAAVFSGLFLISLFLNTMPPLLQEFQRVFQMSIADSGVIPVSHSVGTIVANLFAIFFIARAGTKSSVWLSFSVAFAGLATISCLPSLIALNIGILFIAFSFGLAISSFSTIYAHLPEKMINFSRFHAFFGLGGLVAPLLVKLILSNTVSYRVLYAMYVLVLLAYMLLLKSADVPHHKSQRFFLKDLLGLVSQSDRAIFIFLAAFYATAEMGVVVWAGNFFSQIHGLSLSDSALILSFFWICFTGGRFIGSTIERWIPVEKIPSVMSFLSILSLSGFVFLPKVFSIGCFAVSGFFFANVFPSMHHKLNSESDPDERGPLNALIFLSVSIMGAVIVPALGFIGELSIKVAMFCTLIPFVLILLVCSGKKKLP